MSQIFEVNPIETRKLSHAFASFVYTQVRRCRAGEGPRTPALFSRRLGDPCGQGYLSQESQPIRVLAVTKPPTPPASQPPPLGVGLTPEAIRRAMELGDRLALDDMIHKLRAKYEQAVANGQPRDDQAFDAMVQRLASHRPAPPMPSRITSDPGFAAFMQKLLGPKL
jgi:hypothetical protein